MRNIILLGLTSLLTDISSEMVYPLLPLFLVSLGSGPATLGIIEGIAESSAGLLKAFSGYWSDRLGRRRTLAILGYGGSALGKLFLATAGTWRMFLVGRATDRVGKGIRTAPRDALIAESAGEGKRGSAFGLHRAMDTIGAAIGVLLALGILNLPGTEIRTVILWSLLPAVLGVALLFLVREARTSAPSTGTRPVLGGALLPPRLRRFLLVAALFTLGNSSNTFLLLRASNGHFSLSILLLFYLAYNLSFAACSYPAGRLSDRFGRKKLLATGYAVYAIVYGAFAALPLDSTALTFFVLFSLYGLYSGLTEGIEKAFVVDLAEGPRKATAIGLHATIVGAGLLPASILAGQLWNLLGVSAPFAFGSATSALSALLLILLC